MIKYQDEVLGLAGDVVPNATVTVYLAGTSTLATLYANTAGTASLANPTTTDFKGYFYFYAGAGLYDITISGTGITTQQWTDVQLSPPTPANVKIASEYGGANFSAKVIAAIADVIAAGGGIVDATGLAGIQTISSEIAVGNSSGVSVVLKLSPFLTATCTITNGTGAAFTVYDKSSLIGLGTGGSSNALIKANSSTNVDSLLRTDPSPSGGGSYVHIEGLEIWNDHTTSGTFTNGLIHIQHCYDDSVISRVFARADGVRGWYIHDVCCGTTFYNCGANGFGTVNSEPCVIGKNAEHTNAIFIGFSPVHPGDGKNAILINDVGTSYTALDFYGTYIEANTTDTSTALIQINAGANGTVNMNGVNIAGPAPAVGSTAYLIDISATTKGVTLNNVRRGGLANTINDHVNSRTLTDSYVSCYSFGDSSYINSLKVGASTALTGITGSGASIVTNVSPTLTTGLTISGATATARAINFNTSSSPRWIVRTNNTAEGGANAGSDFEFSARDDSGNFLSTPITIVRSTGIVSTGAAFKVGGAVSPTAAGGQTVGTNALPFSSAFIGAAATNNAQLTGTFTAARTHTLPDITGKVNVYLTGTDAAVDLASVANGACTAERTVTVTGAAFGDAVDVMAGTALEAGTFLIGKVTAADTVKWQFANLSGGAVDRASDTYTIKVRK